jgi:hypothetical protein
MFTTSKLPSVHWIQNGDSKVIRREGEIQCKMKLTYNQPRYTVCTSKRAIQLWLIWLIRQMLKAKEWHIISDEDGSLMTAIYRTFPPEIRRAKAHHFLCKTDRSKTRKRAFAEFRDCEKELRQCGAAWGYDTCVWKLARLRLKHALETHQFDEQYERQGQTQRRWAKNHSKHPLATIDKGYYDVDCTTDLSAYGAVTYDSTRRRQARVTFMPTSTQSMHNTPSPFCVHITIFSAIQNEGWSEAYTCTTSWFNRKTFFHS